MSTYVGIRCLRHGEANKDWIDLGDKEAWECIRLKTDIATLIQSCLLNIKIEIGYSNDMPFFAAMHHTCPLIIEDEYGYEGETVEEYQESRRLGRHFHIH